MKKKPVSTANRLAIQFSLLITTIIILLSIIFVLMLRMRIRTGQKHVLETAVSRLSDGLFMATMHRGQNGQTMMPGGGMMRFSGPQGMMPANDLPYYISFTVYESETKKVFQSNDPFLPLLPLTRGKSLRYRQKDYYIDGDLDILYDAEEVSAGLTTYIIQAAISLDHDTAQNILRGVPPVLLILIVPLLIISYFAALLITRSTMNPVKQMTKAAARIGSENLDKRLPLSGRGDELDTLAVTFNDLFSRLKSDFDRERRFTSDVSHELKTPLAVVLGHANLIRRWGKDDPVQFEKSLTLLISEVHSMETIISNLLQISRLENGKAAASAGRTELYPLFSRLEQDTKAWRKDCEFILVCPRGQTAVFDNELLYQALTIVVSNSIKFAGKPPVITIKVIPVQNEVSIVLSDNGPGIEPEALPHIFERFYRGDPSHNRSKGGSGLGLSIVKVIMNVMGGSVAAESTFGNGTSIIFRIPA
jgi:signal transduction histidine kinase